MPSVRCCPSSVRFRGTPDHATTTSPSSVTTPIPAIATPERAIEHGDEGTSHRSPYAVIRQTPNASHRPASRGTGPVPARWGPQPRRKPLHRGRRRRHNSRDGCIANCQCWLAVPGAVGQEGTMAVRTLGNVDQLRSSREGGDPRVEQVRLQFWRRGPGQSRAIRGAGGCMTVKAFSESASLFSSPAPRQRRSCYSPSWDQCGFLKSTIA